jgi:hypothetical protein
MEVVERVRSAGWWVIAIAWAGLLAYGLHVQFAYATTAGSAGETPQALPGTSRLPRDTVLMFVHAECPCTRASLHELARLMRGRRTAAMLVVAPVTAGRWEDSPAATLAAQIPNLRVFHDEDGREATRFGAQTSGYVAYYDAAGALRYAGGVTGSRGHVGENVALASLRARLDEGAWAQRAPLHPVYGCPLESEP